MSEAPPNPATAEQLEAELHEERWELLRHINDLTEEPIIALAFVWVGLLVIDLTSGLSPLLQTVSWAIWGVFVFDFLLEIWIAPDKTRYLRHNILTALSLALPALRIFRLFRGLRALRAVRTVRTVNLLRVLTSLNRSLRSTAALIGTRSIGYLLAFTIIVIFAGAAGMAAFEDPASIRAAGRFGNGEAVTNVGFGSYGEAVWWTTRVITSSGIEYHPRTTEGRILQVLLSMYALGVFSYITASVASFFIGNQRQPTPSDSAALYEEISALREQIAALQVVLKERG